MWLLFKVCDAGPTNLCRNQILDRLAKILLNHPN